MKKEKFIKTMKGFMSIIDDEEAVSDAMKKLDPDFGYFSLSRYQILVLDILRESMSDEADWIGYWLLELERGTKATKTSVTKDGKNVPIKTLSNLYDCIVNK